MKLENQVCSFELAKKLKELGVKQESLFYWKKGFGEAYLVMDKEVRNSLWNERCFENLFETSDCKEFLSAFTVAELGEELPDEYLVYRYGKNETGSSWVCLPAKYMDWVGNVDDDDTFNPAYIEESDRYDSLAEAMAYALIKHLNEK